MKSKFIDESIEKQKPSFTRTKKQKKKTNCFHFIHKTINKGGNKVLRYNGETNFSNGFSFILHIYYKISLSIISSVSKKETKWQNCNTYIHNM